MNNRRMLKALTGASLLVSLGPVGVQVAFAANCSDPWVTQAVTEVLRRPPPSAGSPECNIKLYNNGSWSSYKELRFHVGTYWSLHEYPKSAAPAPGLANKVAPGNNANLGQVKRNPGLIGNDAGSLRQGRLVGPDGATLVGPDGASVIGGNTAAMRK